MTPLLFAVVTLFWGFTWYAIKLQIGPVPVEVSIFLRFAAASLLMCGGLLLLRKWRPVAWRVHPWLALMGCCLFGVNFILIYSATAHIASGVVAVLFTTSTVFNAVGNWLIYGQRPGLRLIAGALAGSAGIASLFADQIATLADNPHAVTGVVLAVGGTACFSAGNMVSVKLQRLGIAMRDAVARGMGYGAVLLLAFTLLRGHTPTVPADPVYLAALAYLAVPGSIVAFVAYLALLGRVGAGRAAYVTVLFPIVALSVSTWFEGYQWTPAGALGLALVLAGNIVIFAPPLSAWRLCHSGTADPVPGRSP